MSYISDTPEVELAMAGQAMAETVARIETRLAGIENYLRRGLTGYPTTSSVQCDGETHRVEATPAGGLVLHDHPPPNTDEFDREMVRIAMATCKPCRRGVLRAAWVAGRTSGLTTVLRRRYDLKVLADDCREYRRLATEYREAVTELLRTKPTALDRVLGVAAGLRMRVEALQSSVQWLDGRADSIRVRGWAV
jgi:hypothetical protein